MGVKIIRIYQLEGVVNARLELVGGFFEVEVPAGPVAGGYQNKRLSCEDFIAEVATQAAVGAAEPTAQQIFNLLRAGDNIAISIDPQDGKVVITSTVPAAPMVPRPAAPTNGRSDDQADTFAGDTNPAYPALGDYEIYYPGSAGNQPATNGRADLVGNVLTIRGLSGPINEDSIGVRVAASGNRPASAWLTNKRTFTGVIVAPGDTLAPNISLTIPTAGATLTIGQSVQLTATATDNVAVTGVVFTNGATGAVLGTGTKNGNTYSVAYTPTTAGALTIAATASDAAGNNQAASATVNVQAATNQPPSVTINGSSSATVGTGQNYQSVASDSDGVVALVELLLMADASTLTSFSVIGSDDSSPYVVGWTPATAGTSYLRMRATDDKGAQSFSSVLGVAVQAATSGGGTTPGVTYGPPITSSSDYTHTPQGSDLNYNGNGVDEYQSTDGNHRFLPFSEIEYETTSASVVFTQLCTGSSLTASYYANGQLAKTFYGNGTVTVLSPVSTGQAWRPMARNGSQDRDEENGDIKITQAISATFKGGSTTRVVKTAQSELAFFTDANSIYNGAACNKDNVAGDNTTISREKNGVAALLRKATRATVVHGYGSHSGWVGIGTASARQGLKAAYSASRVSGVNRFIHSEVTNGCRFATASQTAVMFAGLVGSLFDLVHADFPNDLYYLETSTFRNDGFTKNIANESLQDYDTALIALGSSRPWLQIVDGQTMVSAKNIDVANKPNDGLHPNKAGHVEYAQSWEAIFAGATKGVGSQSGTGGGTTPTPAPDTVLTNIWSKTAPPNRFVTTASDGASVAKTSGAGAGWDGFVQGLYQVNPPASGVSGLFFELAIGLQPATRAGYVIGLSSVATPTAASGSDVRGTIQIGEYKDMSDVTVWLGSSAGAFAKSATTYLRLYANGDTTYYGRLESSAGTKLGELLNMSGIKYLHGALAFAAADSSGTVISNVTIKGSTLALVTAGTGGSTGGGTTPPPTTTVATPWAKTQPPNRYVTLYDNIGRKNSSVNAWNGVLVANTRIDAPPAGFTGEVARAKLKPSDPNRSGIVVGFASDTTLRDPATDNRPMIGFGMYQDPSGPGPWDGSNSGAQNSASAVDLAIFAIGDGTYYATYTDGGQERRRAAITLPQTLCAVMYYVTTDPGSPASEVQNATLTGVSLTTI